MKKISFYLAALVLLFCSEKSTASWLSFAGQSSLTPLASGSYILSCAEANKTCFSVNFVTLDVIVYGMVLDPNGNPVPGTGQLDATYIEDTFTENPQEGITAKAEIKNLSQQ